MNRQRNVIDEVRELATYTEGFADAVGMTRRTRLHEAAIHLRRYSEVICGQGYPGCRGGPDCDSEHK